MKISFTLETDTVLTAERKERLKLVFKKLLITITLIILVYISVVSYLKIEQTNITKQLNRLKIEKLHVFRVIDPIYVGVHLSDLRTRGAHESVTDYGSYNVQKFIVKNRDRVLNHDNSKKDLESLTTQRGLIMRLVESETGVKLDTDSQYQAARATVADKLFEGRGADDDAVFFKQVQKKVDLKMNKSKYIAYFIMKDYKEGHVLIAQEIRDELVQYNKINTIKFEIEPNDVGSLYDLFDPVSPILKKERELKTKQTKNSNRLNSIWFL